MVSEKEKKTQDLADHGGIGRKPGGVMNNWSVPADWEDGGHGHKLPSFVRHPSDVHRLPHVFFRACQMHVKGERLGGWGRSPIWVTPGSSPEVCIKAPRSAQTSTAKHGH